VTTIAGVRGVLPEHRYSQQAITEAFAEWCLPAERDRRLLRRFHQNAQVHTRHTVVPLERYQELANFGESNDVFIEQGTALGARAVTEALAAAGLAADDVDLILFTTVTGVAAPSLDALIAPLVGFRPDVKVDILSPAYALRDELRARGATVTLEDPYFTDDELSRAGFARGNAEAASVVVLNTAHRHFARPDFSAWRRAAVEVVMDGRNLWNQADVEAAGLLYFGIGRPARTERA